MTNFLLACSISYLVSPYLVSLISLF
uniref:Uncharacterized protein n=1 Tax=Arundo donax TaxID=35708 RepID=A0A0A9HEM7_ARUDO